MKPLQYWKPETFDISSFKFRLDERKGKTYRTSGSDETGKCLYTYNELGFRGDSIKKEGFKVMSLGCSITEGVGVNDNETWPAQFCNHIENGVNFNFGTGGRSNDFISRCLISYFDLIQPDLVLINYTFPTRREYYTKDNFIEPFHPAAKWGYMLEKDGELIHKNLFELQNDNEDFVNWYKNHLLIKNFLENKKCNWVWEGNNLNTEYTEFNRFETGFEKHNGYFKYIDKGADNMHPGKIHHYTYSKKLLNYIYTNFKEYLPKDFIFKQNLL